MTLNEYTKSLSFVFSTSPPTNTALLGTRSCSSSFRTSSSTCRRSEPGRSSRSSKRTKIHTAVAVAAAGGGAAATKSHVVVKQSKVQLVDTHLRGSNLDNVLQKRETLWASTLQRLETKSAYVAKYSYTLQFYTNLRRGVRIFNIYRLHIMNISRQTLQTMHEYIDNGQSVFFLPRMV